jgi:putative endopeptidase
LILHAVSILPPPYDDYHYNFYEKMLEGQHTKLPQKYLTLILVKKYLTQPLSEIYRKYFLKDSLKENTTEFIKKIRNSAIEQINKNKWLQYTTKTIARTKIKEMILSIGWPEKNMPYIFPDLQTNNLLENVYLLSETISIQEIQILNKSIKPGMYWQEPTFNVNAFYYNEINQLLVPAASLMYPFFSEKKSIGWNYGGLGCVIGHEIVHAFDENGKKYGPKGLYKNWWLKIDNRRYNIYSKKLINFYNKTKIYGTFIDGKSTLNENLADLGGISIALHALKNEIKEKTDKEKKQELQDFFISYAVSWRTNQEKQKDHPTNQGINQGINQPTNQPTKSPA